MATMDEGYPFTFTMNDKSEANELLLYTMQYRFRSAKSHHTYIVRVEKYLHHAYCLKFFDKAMMLSKDKFSLRSNTFEPRTIFYTLYHIMIDVLNKDRQASFFFIGAQDEKDEIGEATRRFRVYRKFVSSIIGENKFAHYKFNELSLYVLVNNNAPIESQLLAVEIANHVKQALV